MRAGRWLRVGRLLTVGVLVAAGLLAMNAARATWSTTRNVSAAGWEGQDSPTVAVDRQGRRLLVWAACNSALSGCYHQVQARFMPQGGTMGPILTLSPLGTSSAWPEVDVDDDGDAAVVWEQDSQVVGRRVSRTGALGPLRTLSPEVGSNPEVAVSPGGRALVAWSDLRDGLWRTMAQFFYPDGSVGPLHNFGGGSAEQPAVGVDRNGVHVVAWAQGYDRVVARRIRPGYISPLKDLTSSTAAVGGPGFGMLRVGVDRDGDTLVSFLAGGTNGPRVWVRRWSRSGALRGLLAVSSPAYAAGLHHTVATDLDGDSILVWTRHNAAAHQTELLGRRLTAAGTLGGPVGLGLGDRPTVALDDNGDGLVVWHTPGSPQEATQVKARTISQTGGFGAARTLSSDGRVARTDTSPAGRFAVVWQRRSYPYTIKAAFGP
jgi:hypothetical protein